MRKLAIVVIIGLLGTLSACAPKPKQRSWKIIHDEGIAYMGPDYWTLAHVQERRDEAMKTRDVHDIAEYLSTLALYLWEVEPLLEARDRAASDPDYKYEAPAEIATLDRAALLAEAEALVTEYEAGGAYEPTLWSSLAFVRGDCQTLAAEYAIDMSCQHDLWSSAFDPPRAICGDVTTLCRETFNRMADPDEMYWFLNACGKDQIAGTDKPIEEALATWLTPEELEFYRQMDAVMNQRGAVILAEVAGARADAHAENERRIEEYEKASAEHAANEKQIDSSGVSQIGALDPADRPPPPPKLITSVSIETGRDPNGRMVNYADRVSVGIENGCDEKVEVKEIDTGKVHTIKPGKRIDLDIRRCSQLEVGDRNPTRMSFSRPGVLVTSNCVTFDKKFVRPATPVP